MKSGIESRSMQRSTGYKNVEMVKLVLDAGFDDKRVMYQSDPFCCEICGALAARGRDRLFMCPCRTTAYCSRDCQVKNWNKHKDECRGPLNEKGASEAMVKERKKTGKGAAGGAGGEGGGLATGT
jgi:hypothetical protein